MAFISIIAMLAIGATVGFIVSIIYNTRRFNTSVNLIAGALGAILAGELIPNTLWISPDYIEHILRGVIGALIIIFAINLIRNE